MSNTVSSFAFPLTALGNVFVGKRQYAAGDTFDALTQSDADFLLERGAAKNVDSAETKAAESSVVGVDKTPAALDASKDTIKADASVNTRDAKDTLNEQPTGFGRSSRPGTKRRT